MFWFFVGIVMGLGIAYKFVVEPIKIEMAALRERLRAAGLHDKELPIESNDSEHHSF